MSPFHPKTRALLYSTALTLLTVVLPAGMARANPEGGIVTGGSATITNDANKLNIIQHSDRAIIDWRSFNIGIGEHTQFYQPNSNSVILNRVNGADPSKILGTLTANGNVILINPNGVLFGAGSRVDVNGLVATTADIGNTQFMNGGHTLHFDKAGNPNASVINQGHITAKEAGLIGLVAPNVLNSGIIEAKLGKVELASGDTVTVDMRGHGLFEVAVSDDVKSQIVSNTGTINAAGGTIAMTAAAGKNIVNSLIKVSGELHAPAVLQKGGKIIIGAAGSNAVKNNISANKGKAQGSSHVVVDGVINASGTKAGEKGGSVEITADHIHLKSGSVINTSGDAGGGDIKIGGDYKGNGTTATALSVTMDTGSTILNNALYFGNGGRTILWSDDTTVFKGIIEGKGGSQGGLGGFLETSGKKNLLARGNVTLTASDGSAGDWLLDPTNITIYNRSVGGTDDVNTVTTAYLEAQSVGANIDLTADNNITLDLTGDTLTAATNRNITLTATSGSITTSSGGLIRTYGTGSMLLRAGTDIIFAHNLDLYVGGSGSVTLQAINNILYSGGADITTHGGAIVFNSDRDADQVGYINLDGTSLISYNGAITLGGGLDPVAEAARGDTIDGITLNNAIINAGNANITIRGRSKGNSNGITVKGNTSITTSSNGIGLYGYSLNGNATVISDSASINGNLTIVRVNGDVGNAANAGVIWNSTGGINGRNIFLASNSHIQASGLNAISNTTGNISVTSGGDFQFTGGSLKTNTGTITLNANNNIIVSGAEVSSNGGAITLNSDRDGNSAGAISLSGSSNIISNGGNITLGGGADPTINRAWGVSTVTPSGITLTNSVLNAKGSSGTGGHILLNGSGWALSTETNAVNSSHGVYLSGGTVQTNNNGSITINATAGGTVASSNNAGVYVYNTSTIEAVNNTITINATTTNGNARQGVGFSSMGTNKIQSLGSGDIILTGSGLHGLNFNSAAGGIFSRTGNILLTGISTSAGLNNAGNGGTIGGVNATGTITLITDNTSLDYTNLNIQTTGSVVIKPYTASTITNFGANNSGLYLSANLLNSINASNLTIGRNDGTGLIRVTGVNLSTKNYNLNFVNGSGNIQFDGGVILSLPTNKNLSATTTSGDIVSGGNGLLHVSGPSGGITLTSGNDINFAHNLTLYGEYASGNMILRANNSIIFTGGSDISTNGGAITLNADRDGNGAGAIYLGNGTVLNSQGAAITLGGGADPTTGYAYGTATHITGVKIENAVLNAGAGNVIINGHALNGGNDISALGIWVTGNLGKVQTTSGTITMNGMGAVGGAGNFSHGIVFNNGSNVFSTSGNISIRGTGGDTSNTTHLGVGLNAASLYSTSGNIDVYGSGGNGPGDNSGIYLINNGNVYTTGSGNVTLTGIAGSGTSYGITDAGTTTALGNSAMTGTYTLIADTVNLDNTTLTAASVVIKPYSANGTIGVAGAAGNLQITSNLLNKIYANTLTIGRNDGSGLMRVAGTAITRDYHLNLLNGSGNIQFDGGTTLSLFLNKNLAATTTSGDIVSGGNGTLHVSGSGGITLTSGNDINFAHDLYLYGQYSGGNMILRANNSIISTGGGDIITNGYGAITLNADRDGNGAGAIYLGNGTIINSQGAAITLGGGADPTIGYAHGTATHVAGVTMQNAVLNAGVGNIIINGQGQTNTTTVGSSGVVLYGSSAAITTTTGSITLSGRGAASGTAHSAYGVALSSSSKVSSTSGNISLYGTGGNTVGEYHFGVLLQYNPSIFSQTGNIFVEGIGGTGGSNNSGVFFDVGNIYTTSSGNVTLKGIAGSTGTGIWDFNNALALGHASMSGVYTLTADTLALDKTTLTTNGSVVIKPNTDSRVINVGSGSGGLYLSSVFLGKIIAPTLTIGSAAQNGAINMGTTTWDQPTSTSNLNFITNNGNIVFNGAHDFGRRRVAATTLGTGDIVIDSGTDIMIRGWSNPFTLNSANQIRSTGNGKIEATNGAGSLLIVAGTDINFAHDVDLVGSGANTTITLRANNNIIYSGGGDITTSGGNITLNSNYTNVSGAISLGSGTEVKSNGGNILLGGGPNASWAGAATGNSTYTSGINLSGATIDASGTSTGGNINIRCKSADKPTAATTYSGIELANGALVQTNNTGTVTMLGTGGTGNKTNGVSILSASVVKTHNGNLSITGNAGGNSSAGILVSGTDSSIYNTGSGSILLNATTPNGNAVDLASYGSIKNTAGTIEITSTSASGNGINIVYGTIGTGSGNILFKTGKIGNAYAHVSTTGTVTLTPNNNSDNIYFGGAVLPGMFTDLNFIAGSIYASHIYVGSSAITGNITIGGTIGNYVSPVTYMTSGNIIFNGPQTVSSAGKTMTAQTYGSGDIILGANINGSNNASPITLISARDIKSSAAGTITLTGTGSIVLSAGNDINFAHNYNIAADTGSVTLQANNSILYTGGGDITTNGSAIVLNSDRDTSGAGAIFLGSGTILTSNGGAITLGGGTDPTTGYAYGTAAHGSGVRISDATIDSGAGNITIRGQAQTGGNSTNSMGVFILGSSGIVRSTTGLITITGNGANGGSASHSYGAIVYNGAKVYSTIGDIRITGNGSNGSGAHNYGNVIYDAAVYSNTGNIDIVGTGVNQSAVLITNNGNIYTTGSGNVTITGTGGSLPAITDVYNGSATTIGHSSMTGTLTYVTDNIYLGNTSINTSGSVVFRPYTAGNTIGVAGAPGALQVTTALLNKITASNVTIGRNDGTGLMRVNGVDLSSRNYNLTLLNGSANIQFDGGATALRLGLNKHFTATSTSGKFITSANGTIAMSGAGGITLSNDVILGGNLDITAGYNTYLVFGGTVDGPYDLISGSVVNNGGVVFNGAWGGTSALGNISLTAWSNITLPAITTLAGKTVNIKSINNKITTSSIFTGTNGNITLTSQNLDINGTLSGTGIITLQPSAGRIIDINYGTDDNSTYHLSTADLNNLGTNWSRIYIGRNDIAGGLSTGLRLGSASFVNPVTFKVSDTVNLRGNLTGTGNASFTWLGNGTNVIAAQGTTQINTAGGGVYFDNINFQMYNDPALTITTNGGDISFYSIHNNASVGNTITANSGGGNITVSGAITNSAPLSTVISLAFNAGAGNVSFGSTVDGVYDITANGSNINFNGAWGASQGLGNITLTATNALTLPSIRTQDGKTVSMTSTTNRITTSSISTGTNGNITLTSENVTIGGALLGTGTLTLTPYTNRNISVNYGADDNSTYYLDATEVSRISDGWNKINIGKNSTSTLFIGNSTWHDPVEFRGYKKYYYGNIRGENNASITSRDNSDIFGTITTTGNDVFMSGVTYVYGGSVTTNGGNATLGSLLLWNTGSDFGLTVNTAGGDINLDSINYSHTANPAVYNFNAGTGDIHFNDTVDGLNAIITASGNTITMNGAWGGSYALGNVTLTSVDTIVLPSITTSTNSNILITTTGTNANITNSGSGLISTSGTGTVTLRSNNSILLAGQSISTAGGAITLNSDRDASGAGAIELSGGSSLTSNGGAITLGGGADPTTTAAYGTAGRNNGIYITDSAINAGTGNISLRGQGETASSTPYGSGIWILGGSTIQTTTGQISINGTGTQGGASVGSYGVDIRDGASVFSTSGAINIAAIGGNTSGGSNAGLVIYNGSVYSNTGNLSLTGTAGAGDSNIGVYTNGVRTVYTTGSGNVTITGIGSLYGAGITDASSANTYGHTSMTGTLQLIADSLAINSTDIISAGSVVFKPYTVGNTVGVAGGTGNLQIATNLLNRITASNILIGDGNTGTIRFGTADLSARDTNISASNGGNIEFDGALTLGNRALSVSTGVGNIVMNTGSSISSNAADTAILLYGQNFINHSGSSVLNAPNGRWLVYSNSPTTNVRGGLTPNAAAIYGYTVPSAVAAGNRFVFFDSVSNAPNLSLVVNNQSKVYGSYNPTLTYGLTGFVGDDTNTGNVFGITVSTAADKTLGVGSAHVINGAFGTLASYLGYTTSTTNGTMTVTPKALTITANNQTKAMGSNFTFTGNEFTHNGLVNGDTITSVTFASPGANPAATDSGSPYVITASNALGTGLSNYAITYQNGSFTVTAGGGPVIPPVPPIDTTLPSTVEYAITRPSATVMALQQRTAEFQFINNQVGIEAEPALYQWLEAHPWLHKAKRVQKSSEL